MKEVKIAGFGGSLRKGSFNRMLLNAATSLMPEHSTLEIAEISDIPLFNQDLEKNMPPAVVEFKRKISAADGVLISTPEYNYSVPGFLKNVIDWGSRPYGESCFESKPVALMSAGGRLGGARAQYSLRQSFVFLNMRQFNMPEVFVMNPADKFDENGNLKDEGVRENIRQLLQRFVEMCRE
jgi:chromate reductase